MPVGPYSQDVLTRIFNVQWGGGGVFVAVSGDGNIFYLNLAQGDTGTPAWENLGTLDFVSVGPGDFIPFPAGCSYAMIDKRPVFVLVGGAGNTTSPGIIMASRNGKNWSRVFTYANSDAENSTGASVWAVVWDENEQKFFAGGHQSADFDDAESGTRWMSETDLLFSSSDGFGWAEAGRNETRTDAADFEPLPELPRYTTGLLNPHCSNRMVDRNGNGISDGYYGFDKGTGLLIKPADSATMDYLFGSVGVPYKSGIAVEFFGEGDPPPFPPAPELANVTCVATAGDMWVVAGGIYDPAGGSQPPFGGGSSQASVLGTDETGERVWKQINPPGTNAIIAMCGGALSQEPSAKRRQNARL